ncbi:MAG: hypothetical protein Kow0090_17020 [Myxococcota bacterium]
MNKSALKRTELLFLTAVIISALFGFAYGCSSDGDADATNGEGIGADKSGNGEESLFECYIDAHCGAGKFCTKDGACSVNQSEGGGKYCVYDSDCDASSVCLGDRCVATECENSSECADKTIEDKKYKGECMSNVCVYKRAFTGEVCSSPDDCVLYCTIGEPECTKEFVNCFEGVCGPKKCKTNYDCVTGTLCNKLNECEPGPSITNTCITDSDCPSGKVCNYNICQDIGSPCNDDSDCVQNAICLESRCAIVKGKTTGDEYTCAEGVYCYEVKNERTASGVCLASGEKLPTNARICSTASDCFDNEAALTSVSASGDKTCHCVRKCPGGGGSRCAADEVCFKSTIQGVLGYCLTSVGQIPPGASLCDPITQIGCDSSEYPFVAAGAEGGALCVCLKKCTPPYTPPVGDDDDVADDDDNDDNDTCEFEVCGETCCGEGEVCYQDACCAPACEGKECGDDSCGGVCGYCEGGEECANGVCAPATYPCADVGECVLTSECSGENQTIDEKGTCESEGEVCCVTSNG